MTNATTWKDLDDIMLSAINQSPKDKHCMILLIEHLLSSVFIEIENRMVVDGNKWGRKLLFNGGIEFQVFKMKSLEIGCKAM